MNKRLISNFNKACSRYIKSANNSRSAIDYEGLFDICNDFLRKATNNGAGICNCADSKKIRSPDGKDYVMHTCGNGFFDALNNSGWTQVGPGWGGGINKGSGFFDSLNNSGWTQVGPGWGGGIFDSLKNVFNAGSKIYDANKGIFNIGAEAVKRKAGSIAGYVPEKMVRLAGEGFGGAWGPYSHVHSTDDIMNWAKDGLETISKVAESV